MHFSLTTKRLLKRSMTAFSLQSLPLRKNWKRLWAFLLPIVPALPGMRYQKKQASNLTDTSQKCLRRSLRVILWADMFHLERKNLANIINWSTHSASFIFILLRVRTRWMQISGHSINRLRALCRGGDLHLRRSVCAILGRLKQLSAFQEW